MPNKNGLHLITPTSIASTGTGNSSSINTNGSVTFSTCATLSLNGVFSSTYDNYMIVYRGVGTGSTNYNLRFRLRASGTDNSTASSYTFEQLVVSGSGVGIAERNTASLGWIGAISPTQRDGFVAQIYAPYLAQPTALRSVTVVGDTSASMYDQAMTHNQSTAYDGFTIWPAGDAFTGLIAVYGMRN